MEQKIQNKISSGAFADDLICLTGTYANLRIQAKKLSLYADWAHLIISGTKTKVTCNLLSRQTMQIRGNTSVADFARHQLKDKIVVQGKPAQFIYPGDPFTYLGVEITMTLDWKPQLDKMKEKLTQK